MDMVNVVSVGLTYARLLKTMKGAGCASISTPLLLIPLFHAEMITFGQLG
jgi:hypothetical protein